LGELALQLDALGGELQQALAAVAGARSLQNEALPHQLAQHPAQALLGDAQDAQQLGHGHLRIAADEQDHSVMRAARGEAGEDCLRLGGEVAVGVEEELDALAQLLLAQEEQVVGGGFYVSHVDLFSAECYCWSQARDIIAPRPTTSRKDLSW